MTTRALGRHTLQRGCATGARRFLLAWLSLLGLVAALTPHAARAHESGFTSLHLRVDGEQITGTWESTTVDALILLAPAFENGDDLPKPRPLDPAETTALGNILLGALELNSNGQPCSASILREVDAAGAGIPGARQAIALELSAHCPAAVGTLRIRYPVLFDLDEKHRGYYSVQDFRGYQAGVFTADRQEAVVDIRQYSALQTAREYGWEGARHIWTGIDHVLFLVALLLPAVLLPRDRASAGESTGIDDQTASPRPEGEAEPTSGFRRLLTNVVWIVSAFTVAHSITLSLAFFGIVRLPSRPVEVVIAASVFVAAWNNVRPFLSARRSGAAMAFGFGLIHGLGFASALAQLGLPSRGRVLALLSFNLGVEAGQIAIVALALPAMYYARSTRAYEHWVVRGGSLVIAWLAVVWIVERLMGVDLISWI
ncbi:MAG: HupE/UreJ family protein [Deltaproteobacteria bacterium]|nr:HupE/UreJ family protein [Deltaproteobacteria bacterium]